MGVVQVVMGFFTPILNLIEKMIPSAKDKNELKVALEEMKVKVFEVQNEIALSFLEYEKKLLEGQSKVVEAEIQGASWLQRNWRPITMMC